MVLCKVCSVRGICCTSMDMLWSDREVICMDMTSDEAHEFYSSDEGIVGDVEKFMLAYEQGIFEKQWMVDKRKVQQYYAEHSLCTDSAIANQFACPALLTDNAELVLQKLLQNSPYADIDVSTHPTLDVSEE